MSSPLERFNKKNPDRWEILTDTPQWEQSSIMEWINSVLVISSTDIYGKTSHNYQYGVIRSVEKKHRLILAEVLGFDTGNWTDMARGLWRLLEEDTEKFILFLEMLVIYVRDSANRRMWYDNKIENDADVLKYLQHILDNGSKWRILYDTNASAGLIEVVDENLRKIAEDLSSNDLKEAWEAAFKPHPNPELAIDKAQSAIEHFASEYRLTNATSKVYGTLLGDIRKHKDKNYVTVAKPEYDLSNVLAGEKSSEQDANEQYFDWVWTGLNLIQRSNPTRHKSKATTEFKVSPEAGKQAVLIATLMCELIKSGYIARVKKQTT